MNKNYYAVIMAGGVGSRFWPVSTPEFPKQFHDMLGTGETLVQKTFTRLSQLIPKENILILTNDKYSAILKEQLPMITNEQIVLEPDMRNTAPCILSSVFLKFFSGPGCSPVGGNFFGLPCWACVLRAGVLCFSRGRAAANSPPVPGKERRAVPCWGWPGVLLVQPLAELFTELLDGLALVSEYQEPEPFGLLRLLYKQFASIRRGHVHLPFLVAVVGGSLGGGRCGRPLALHDSGGFLRRQ